MTNPSRFHFNRPVSAPLLPGDYYLSVCCYSLRDGVPQAIDHWERAYEFTISERVSDQHGVVAFETNWALNR